MTRWLYMLPASRLCVEVVLGPELEYEVWLLELASQRARCSMRNVWLISPYMNCPLPHAIKSALERRCVLPRGTEGTKLL